MQAAAAVAQGTASGAVWLQTRAGTAFRVVIGKGLSALPVRADDTAERGQGVSSPGGHSEQRGRQLVRLFLDIMMANEAGKARQTFRTCPYFDEKGTSCGFLRQVVQVIG